jgi:hypothetical protein
MESTVPKKTSVLYFSTNKLTQNESFVRQSIEEVLKVIDHPHPHLHLVIVIADTIKAPSYIIIDKKKPHRAKAMCLEAGDTIASFVSRFCEDKNIEIPIYRWDNIINDPHYRDCYERATREIDSKPALKQRLTNLSLDFLKRRDAQRPWKQKEIEVSVDFFVQEISSFRRVRFANIIIDRVFYTPEKMITGQESYRILSEVGNELTGIGELVPHQLIRVQCINQDEPVS